MFNDFDNCSSCGCVLKENTEERTFLCEKCQSIDVQEHFYFDKYIDDILIKESKVKKVDQEKDTPQRALAKKARRMPSESIKFGKKA